MLLNARDYNTSGRDILAFAETRFRIALNANPSSACSSQDALAENGESFGYPRAQQGQLDDRDKDPLSTSIDTKLGTYPEAATRRDLAANLSAVCLADFAVVASQVRKLASHLGKSADLVRTRRRTACLGRRKSRHQRSNQDGSRWVGQMIQAVARRNRLAASTA